VTMSANERAHPSGTVGSPVENGDPVVDHYRLMSLPVQVRSADDWFVRAVRWHLEPFRRPGPESEAMMVEERHEPGEDGGGTHVYSRNGLERYRGSAMGVIHYAIWDIHAIVPQSSRDFLFIHAGSVARNGGALLLPGPAGRGKSSLVAALLRRGFGYLSDEAGAIDPVSSRAYPFPKRLSLEPDALVFFPGLEARLQDVEAAGAALGKRYVRPEDMDAAVAVPSPIERIVFLGPQRSGTPRVTRIGQAEAVERLAASSLNLYRYRERGVILLSRVVLSAEALELSGGDPNDLAAAIEELG